MTYRVGIIGIQHESNTFLKRPTTLEDFRRDIYAESKSLIDRMRFAHHEVGGFIEELERSEITIVPILFARALPSGVIDHATAHQIVDRAVDLLIGAGPLDGLLFAPHGAAVSEPFNDFDGHWLTLVRRAVGATVPIVCTIDPHGNLSDQMVVACDAIVAYRTNPHIDQRDRGKEAATLLIRHLRGEIRLVQAAGRPPLIINIERQRTSVEPCVSLYHYADKIRAIPGVLSVSIVLGFPYADVAEMGSTFVVVCDNAASQAQKLSDELAAFAWSEREQYRGQLIDVETALMTAAASKRMCVLLDMGDNVGGGGPGNTMEIVRALQRRNMGPSVATIFDGAAVDRAISIGVGGQADFVVGAIDGEIADPFKFHATVEGIYSGKFSELQPRHGGATEFDMGTTAVLVSGGMTLIVTSRRLFPVSLEQYRACGLDVSHYRFIVAKGVHAPIAAYEGLDAQFIHVNTQGVTSADLSTFDFVERRRPLFPFEQSIS